MKNITKKHVWGWPEKLILADDGVTRLDYGYSRWKDTHKHPQTNIKPTPTTTMSARQQSSAGQGASTIPLGQGGAVHRPAVRSTLANGAGNGVSTTQSQRQAPSSFGGPSATSTSTLQGKRGRVDTDQVLIQDEVFEEQPQPLEEEASLGQPQPSMVLEMGRVMRELAPSGSANGYELKDPEWVASVFSTALALIENLDIQKLFYADDAETYNRLRIRAAAVKWVLEEQDIATNKWKYVVYAETRLPYPREEKKTTPRISGFFHRDSSSKAAATRANGNGATTGVASVASRTPYA